MQTFIKGTMLNAYVNGDQMVTDSDSISSFATRGEGSIGVWSDQNPTTRRNGVTLARVDSGGPSGAVGIKPGDVILAIGDHYVYTAGELSIVVSGITPGTRVAVRYQRRSTIYDTSLVVSTIEPKGPGPDLPPTK
jgi:S1-C subfamily serine protease